MHSARHLVERCCCKLKPFRGIAARYDEARRNFLAGVHLAASAIPLNRGHALAMMSMSARETPTSPLDHA